MGKLVLLRHGQSQWNLENRFTGWIDVPLTDLGRAEAIEAGRRLRAIGFTHAFTSVLIRAIETLELALKGAGQPDVPVTRDKALNERMYGDLQGLDKAECAVKFGPDQVHIWRRSYDVCPPNGESLEKTAQRTLPYFETQILPLVKGDQHVIISAHGNSLRAIVMKLDNLSREEVLELNIPNGIPIVYEIGPDGEPMTKEILTTPVEESVENQGVTASESPSPGTVQ